TPPRSRAHAPRARRPDHGGRNGLAADLPVRQRWSRVDDRGWRVGVSAPARGALPILKHQLRAEFLVAGIGLEALHEIFPLLQLERALLDRTVEPGERLVVLAQRRVDQRDVDRATFVTFCASEQRREYSSRL